MLEEPIHRRIVDKAHLNRNLAKQLARALLLFLENLFDLFLRHRADRDEEFAEAQTCLALIVTGTP